MVLRSPRSYYSTRDLTFCCGAALRQLRIISVVQIFGICNEEEGHQKSSIRMKLESTKRMTMPKKLANATNTLAKALIVMMLLVLGGSVHAQPPEKKFVVRDNLFFCRVVLGRYIECTLCRMPAG